MDLRYLPRLKTDIKRDLTSEASLLAGSQKDWDEGTIQRELTKTNWAEGIDVTNNCRLINEANMRVLTKQAELAEKEEPFEQNTC